MTLLQQGKVGGWRAPHFITGKWSEKSKFPGWPSLTLEGGVLITAGWRWEYRLTDCTEGSLVTCWVMVKDITLQYTSSDTTSLLLGGDESPGSPLTRCGGR